MRELLTWAEWQALTAHPHYRRQPRWAPGTGFWDRIVKGAADECWPWAAGYQTDGYGMVYDPARRRTVTAHRMAWTLVNGPIPPRVFVLHRCDNRRCCNPDHLYLGTAKDNGNDRRERVAAERAAGLRVPGYRIDPWAPIPRGQS